MTDPSQTTLDSAVSREKVRARFVKGGELRFVSHHDLLRCFERMLRRAEIPVCQTQGFNPRPRLVFALSLPLGVIGCEEVVEIDLVPETFSKISVDEIQKRLSQVAPPGLRILSCQEIPFREKAHVQSMTYRLRLSTIPEALGPRIEELMRAEELWITRTTMKKNRTGERTSQVNVRPFLRDVKLSGDAVEIQLWLRPEGTARPLEILELLQLRDLYEAGAILERSRLELREEEHANQRCNE